jgi:hypothetical protein
MRRPNIAGFIPALYYIHFRMSFHTPRDFIPCCVTHCRTYYLVLGCTPQDLIPNGENLSNLYSKENFVSFSSTNLDLYW